MQQTVGYIAQHLEAANYGLCERSGATPHASTAKDSLADTLKAKWPKDTLVARRRAVAPLWAQSATEFFINAVDAQLTVTRDTSGAVTGFVVHQYGRDRTARKLR